MGGMIGQGATVYLDANAIIYLTEGNPPLKTSMEKIVSEIQHAAARVITSELTFTEILVLPFRTKNSELIMAYESLTNAFVEPIPIGRKELFLAAKLRADTVRLRTPDALHLATAILSGADIFVTGDAGLDIPAPMKKIIL